MVNNTNGINSSSGSGSGGNNGSVGGGGGGGGGGGDFSVCVCPNFYEGVDCMTPSLHATLLPLFVVCHGVVVIFVLWRMAVLVRHRFRQIHPAGDHGVVVTNHVTALSPMSAIGSGDRGDRGGGGDGDGDNTRMTTVVVMVNGCTGWRRCWHRYKPWDNTSSSVTQWICLVLIMFTGIGGIAISFTSGRWDDPATVRWQVSSHLPPSLPPSPPSLPLRLLQHPPFLDQMW